MKGEICIMGSKVACNIRIDETLWLKLKKVAEVNKRSVNKEIEFLIETNVKNFEYQNGKIEIKE